MLFDTHAHINFNAYGENYKQLIDQTLAQGVWLNNVGTQKETSANALKIAREYEQGVYAVVGLHPGHSTDRYADEEESTINEIEEFDYNFYLELAKDPKVVGIGECGLDYYRVPDGMNIAEVKAIQAPVFRQHCKLAKELNKTLVIHCRSSKDNFDAYQETLAILDQEKVKRFEVHSFTTNWVLCKRFLDLGGYIGLNGIITFDKTGILEEVIKNLPLERLLLETDAPYLAPVPFRGKKNEPAYVKYVAEHIAKVRGISAEEVAEITTKNAKTLFEIRT